MIAIPAIAHAVGVDPSVLMYAFADANGVASVAIDKDCSFADRFASFEAAFLDVPAVNVVVFIPGFADANSSTKSLGFAP